MLRVSKDYDAAFTSLAEDDPRALLFLFGGVPLDAEGMIEPLPRKIDKLIAEFCSHN